VTGARIDFHARRFSPVASWNSILALRPRDSGV
jgi:hypothetical protein